MGVRAEDEPATAAEADTAAAGPPAKAEPTTGHAPEARPAAPAAASVAEPAAGGGPDAAGQDAPGQDAPGQDAPGRDAPGPDAVPGLGSGEPGEADASDEAEGGVSADGVPAAGTGSRRPPAVTLDTARPEGGGRAAPGDAPAPARQWPLLLVLSVVGLGLLVIGLDPFPQAPRVGALLAGAALLTGAVLRRVLPSVGMLAVRSRFTDMATYGLLGAAIVFFALMTQPDPWLEIPLLEKAVKFAVR
ncbi:hypothetical protein C6N75_12920 [Streptomyces solincola]|uniref:DUF3017 domain-containing protein n=1 Tax=Streptomyces solincola TaxID=2100817 RepID=A0A2S9PWT2_9ACTN|nr:DUF3017 domain-containing protein [Streptomyces solincola]PRH78813.1 hypothetical protein C6N75_12920 [Streptomyces solincola]